MKKRIAVLVGPSGVGKSTLCKAIIERLNHLRPLETVSTTTRRPRPGEVDGVHYHFVSNEEFARRVAAGAFLEHAEYGNQRYGTERRMVDDLLKRTPLLVANLEIYGCRQLRVTRRDALFLPVLPGHRRDLEMRLRERSDAKPENVTQRLRKGIWESAIIKAGEFGEPIVNYNGCLAATVDALVARIQPHVVSL